EILGVPRTASDSDIKKRYRELARQYHPDVARDAGAEQKFRLINEAYRILSDPERRKVYDSELKLADLKRPGAQSGRTGEGEKGRTANARPSERPNARTNERPNTRTPEHPNGNTPEYQNPQPTASPADTLIAEAEAAYKRRRLREAEDLCRQALRHSR